MARLLVEESVSIPPMSQVIIHCRSENEEMIDTRYAALEPVSCDSYDVLIAKAVVDPFSKTIPVRIVNLHICPLKLRRNCVLGDLSSFVEIEQVTDRAEDPTIMQSD